MRLSRPALIALACLGAAPAAYAAAPARSPLALSCLGCHQPGVTPSEFPPLGGLSAATIAASLKQSRDQPDATSIMSRFVKNISDAQIDQLAAELGAASP